MQHKNKYFKGFLIALITTVVIVTVSIGFTGLGDNLEKLKSFTLKFAFVSMGLIVLKWIIETILLKLSLFSEGKKINFFQCFNIVILGQFFSYLTPFFTGGQPVQVYYLSKYNISAGQAAAAILYKSMFFQIVLTVMGFFAFFYSVVNFSSYLTVIILLGTLLNGFVFFLIILFSMNMNLSKRTVKSVVLFLKKIKIFKNVDEHMTEIMSKVEDFIIFFRQNSRHLLNMVLVIILSFFQIISYILTILVVMKGFSVPINKDLFFRALSLDVGASVVPTPGTAGGSEGIYYLLFSPIIDIFTINTGVIIWRFTTYYFVLIVGGMFFLFNSKKKKTGDF